MKKLLFLAMMICSLQQPMALTASWAMPSPWSNPSDDDKNADFTPDVTVSKPFTSVTETSTVTTAVRNYSDVNSDHDDHDSLDTIKRKQSKKEELDEYFAGLQRASQERKAQAAIENQVRIKQDIATIVTGCAATILDIEKQESQAAALQQNKKKSIDDESAVATVVPSSSLFVDDTQTLAIPMPLKPFQRTRALECDDIKSMLDACAASHENGNYLIGMSEAMGCDEEPDDEQDASVQPMYSAGAFVVSSAFIGAGGGLVLGPVAAPLILGVMAGITANIIYNQYKNHRDNKKASQDGKKSKKPEDPKGPKKPDKEYTYEHGKIDDSDKHHPNSKNGVGKSPRDAQDALDKSVPVKGSDQRVTTQDKKIVVLKESAPNSFHAYVVENYNKLAPAVKKALFDGGFTRSIQSGKVIK